MSARSIRMVLVLAVAVASLALPTGALGAADKLSAVDAIAADVSVDGAKDSTKPSTQTSASDSPMTDTYSGGSTDAVPPPVTCGSPAGSSADSKPASGTSTSRPATESCAITECSPSDTDGKDANGKPCVECSSVDTDGMDASGKACVAATTTELPATTTVVTETPCTDGGGSGDGITPVTTTPVTTGTTVCGGGGTPEAPEALPTTGEPVAGGGEPVLPAEPTAIGGGAPELPFTGLPLWYAIYAGLGLVLAGGALWARGRFGDGRA